jgi:DNA-binding NtrC family response regulator
VDKNAFLTMTIDEVVAIPKERDLFTDYHNARHNIVMKAVERCDGNLTQAAAYLGIDRASIYNIIDVKKTRTEALNSIELIRQRTAVEYRTPRKPKK